MSLDVTYYNERLEVVDGTYDEDRARQLRSLSRLYNTDLGPVTRLTLIRPEPADFSLFGASCKHVPIATLVKDLAVKAAPYSRHVPGGGKGARPVDALLGALGEVAERLLATLHATAAGRVVPATSYAELADRGVPALAPAQLPLFAAEQYDAPGFPFRRFTEDCRVGWVEGRRLRSGRPVLVPAQLVLMYYRMEPDEPPIGYATTAGLALHTSRRRAIVHGIYEQIERDHLNLSWYCRIPPPRVEVDLRRFLSERFGVASARVRTPKIDGAAVFANRLDLPVPVLTVLAVNHHREERAFFGGSGAGSTRSAALAQALFEVGQCQTAFRFEDPFGRDPISADTPLSQVVEFFDAPLYFGHARHLPRVSWFTSAPETLDWANLPTLRWRDEVEEYDRTLRLLAECDLDPIVVDVGAAAFPGVAVTKVYLPELTQACPPANPPLGHPRFYELPWKLGRTPVPLTFADLNPDPVPLA